MQRLEVSGTVRLIYESLGVNAHFDAVVGAKLEISSCRFCTIPINFVKSLGERGCQSNWSATDASGISPVCVPQSRNI